jgi:hypothetical protein
MTKINFHSRSVKDHGNLTGLGDDDHSQYVLLTPTTDSRNTIQPSAATVKGLIIKGAASQSDSLLEWQDSSGNVLTAVDSAGNIQIRSQLELRFYDNGNYVGFEAPALSGNQIWVLPDADGPANEALGTDNSGNLIWRTHDELAGFVANEHIDWTSASDNFSTSGSITAASANGLDYNPGSDTDTDLITVGVDGTPIIKWDESEDSFSSNKGMAFPGGGVAIGVASTTELLQVDKDGDNAIILFQSFKSNNPASVWRGRGARGSQATPTAVAEDDVILGLQAFGHDGAGYHVSSQINFAIDGEVASGGDPTDMPGRIEFYTTPDGSGSASERMRIDNSGGVFMYNLKSGANQGAAGAAANELWVDTGDQTIKLGT